MTGVETEADISLSSGSVSVRVSSTGNGVCVDEEGRSGLVWKGTTVGMLGSCGMARARVIEILSSWI